MPAIIDYVDDLVQLMLNTSAITALTGQRIYGEVLPRADFKEKYGWSEPSGVLPTIVIREAKDTQIDRQGPLGTITYEVICYGNSPGQARELNAAVRDALNDEQNITTPGGREFQFLTQATAGQGGADEDKWEFFASRWIGKLFID